MTLFPFSMCYANWAHTPVVIDPAKFSNNGHYNSGGRRIVRINNTIITLVNANNSDHIYRSLNNGSSWAQIDEEYGYSGTLISGANNYVYHFSRFDANIRMVKFLYNATVLPETVNICSLSGRSEHGEYKMLNATVDQNGGLYVFFHYNTGSGGDSIFLVKSVDFGTSWSSPILIRAGNNHHSWGFMHSDVTPEGDIVLVYSEWDSLSIQYAISSDDGETWNHSRIATNDAFNPSILPVGGGQVYVFAQSPAMDGLVFNKSINNGIDWSGWRSIQANHAGGYADPSPAVGSDNTIFVAFRGAERYTTSSDDLREHVAMSSDGGDTWHFPDNHLGGGRVGTRSVMRYQTWWNYGGPLEWTWLEEVNGNYPTFYDFNNNISIKNLTSPHNATPSSPSELIVK